MFDKVFSGIVLPVRPAMAADGANITVVEITEEAEMIAPDAFFGGYAEDFLADLGFDMMETAPEAKPGKAKRTQG